MEVSRAFALASVGISTPIAIGVLASGNGKASSFFLQEQRRLASRYKTGQQQQLFQLRSIKVSLRQREQRTKERQTQRRANQEAEKYRPRRLGKLK
jgi:hypothetical protein